jgi:TPR repeat protein
MGVVYELGLGGVTTDMGAAEACYAEAAGQQHVGALIRLGHVHLQMKRSTAAKKCFQEAADLGSAEGLLQLAKLAAHNALQIKEHSLSSSIMYPLSPGGLSPARSDSFGLSVLPSPASHQQEQIFAASKTAPQAAGSISAEAAQDTAMQLYYKAAAAGSAEAQHVVGCR